MDDQSDYDKKLSQKTGGVEPFLSKVCSNTNVTESIPHSSRKTSLRTLHEQLIEQLNMAAHQWIKHMHTSWKWNVKGNLYGP